MFKYLNTVKEVSGFTWLTSHFLSTYVVIVELLSQRCFEGVVMDVYAICVGLSGIKDRWAHNDPLWGHLGPDYTEILPPSVYNCPWWLFISEFQFFPSFCLSFIRNIKCQSIIDSQSMYCKDVKNIGRYLI